MYIMDKLIPDDLEESFEEETTIEKPKRKVSDKQREALEKGRIARQSNITSKKQPQVFTEDNSNVTKVEPKVETKVKPQKMIRVAKPIVVEEDDETDSEDDSEEETQIIIKRRPTKSKKTIEKKQPVQEPVQETPKALPMPNPLQPSYKLKRY